MTATSGLAVVGALTFVEVMGHGSWPIYVGFGALLLFVLGDEYLVRDIARRVVDKMLPPSPGNRS